MCRHKFITELLILQALVRQITTPDRQNGNYMSPQQTRPEMLPLRCIDRPDGLRSDRPDGQSSQTDNNGDGSGRSGLGPGGLPRGAWDNDSLLFSTASSLTINTDTGEQLEYDDYVAPIPGSFLSMQPSAYTLTWNKNSPPTEPSQSTA